MFKAIYNSAKKSLKGEEKLWIVFWLWGFLVYLFWFTTLGAVKILDNVEWNAFGIIPATIALFLGIFNFACFSIYSIALDYALFINRKNTIYKEITYILIAIIPVLIFFQFAFNNLGSFLGKGYFYSAVKFYKGIEQ